MVVLKSILLLFLIFNSNLVVTLELVEKESVKLDVSEIYTGYGDGFYLFNDNLLYYLNNDRFDVLVTHNKNFDNILTSDEYIIFYNINKLTVFDRKNKKVLWEKVVKGRITSNIVMSSNMLFINKNFGVIMAFDIKTGKICWKFRLEMSPLTWVSNTKLLQTFDYLVYIHANKKIYVFTKNLGNRVKTSNIGYNFSANCDRNASILSSRVYNGIVYTLYSDGRFVIYDMLRLSVILIRNNFNYKDFYVFNKQIIFLDKNNVFLAYDKNLNALNWKTKSLDSDLESKMLFLPDKSLILFYNSSGTVGFLDTFGNILCVKNFMLKIKDVAYNNDTLLILFAHNENILFSVNK